MNFRKSDIALAYLTLLCGLTISAVAIWYSVAGLVAIFAAAALPIIIMGTVLEISKLIATVWLKWNWNRAPKLIKAYLLTAIAVLMLLTSMGIFGFLSKAHLDQAVPTSDVAAKIALIDEKINTERQNIETARKSLAQMDATVDQTIARSTNEGGASRAAQLRRTQQKERTQLQAEIAKSQKTIAALNEERAPIAAELRKVEAEVGPIKYIAALIYGDNPENNLLEKAVRWVIIVIVLVFDPLAVILLLASQYSFRWFRQQKDEQENDTPDTESEPTVVAEDTATEIPKEEPAEVVDNEPMTVSNISSTPSLNFSTAKDIPVTGDLTAPERFGLNVRKEPTFTLPKEETKEVVKEPVVESLVDEELLSDEEILSDAELAEKEAMKRWKEDHPNDSLKHQRRLFELKLIDHLPWQDYLAAKPDYVQNEEQSTKTIWQRLKNLRK